jgi:hypothetical protein
MARWLLAALGFLAIGWLSVTYGHTVAFVALMAALLFVAVFGGHGRRRGPEPPVEGGPAAEDPDPAGKGGP